MVPLPLPRPSPPPPLPPTVDAHTTRRSYEWNDQRDTPIMTATFPIHPLSALQAPFEESMLEATGETGHVPFPTPKKGVKTRQQLLCRHDQAAEPAYNLTYNCHWRHHPKAKFHPLVKTVAQIIFGVHLLHRRLEKSVADVADILLKHVNELDSFLQRANEDLEASLKDMLFRHKCLKVPMEHVNEFDRLLEDRAYRAQLLDGNIVIERTIGRMSTLLNDYLIDINTFREANHQIDAYLLDIGHEWTARNDDIARIYSAMRGNTGGWAQFLQSLVAKAERLGVVLVQVSSYCNEIEKRCGAASRRSLVSHPCLPPMGAAGNPGLTHEQIATRTSSRNSSNSRETGRSFRTFANNKPLPTPPSDRPPFVPSSHPDSDPHSGNTTPQRHSQINPPKPQPLQPPQPPHHPDAVNSDSTTETPKRSEDSSSTSVTSMLDDGDARHSTGRKQADYLRATQSHDDHRGRQSPQADVDSRRTSRLVLGRQRDDATPVPKNEEGSPPWTGKDSAYSSVSGTSPLSPAVAPPRSGSSMSSRTAQFGLFPTRNAMPTPKGSLSGRHGAQSPPFSQTARFSRSPDMLSRPPTAMSSFSDTPSKKHLSKRNSFTSLKRFFSKKKAGDIATITE